MSSMWRKDRFYATRVPLVTKVANTDTEYLRIMRAAINRELKKRAQDKVRAREETYA